MDHAERVAEELERLLYQTKLHIERASTQGLATELHDLHRIHVQLETTIHEMRMIQARLR
jgi:hypothetical protein